jgi:hypothetical protein
MFEKVLGDVDSWCWLYLVAKSSLVRGRCGRASLSYTVLWSATVRQGDRASYQVLPCPVELRWAVAPFRGCKASELGYLVKC